MKKTVNEKKIAKKLTEDENQKDWESGTLGRSIKHTKKLSMNEVQEYFGNNKGTSVRLPPSLIDKLKLLAAKKGLGYQAYMRMILIEHVQNEN